MAVAIAALFVLWFSLSDTVPASIVGFTPYLTTLLVLALASQRLRPPGSRRSPVPQGRGLMTVDWAPLRAAATEVARNAYAPYSRLHVGAAGLVDDGRVITGCNVENASYGLGLCAECSLVSVLNVTGGGRLVAVSVVAGDGQFLAPCGRCRQVLYEFGGAGLLIDAGGDADPYTMADLLPVAFGPEDIDARREA